MPVGIQVGLDDAKTYNPWPQDLQSSTPQAVPSTHIHPHTKKKTEHKEERFPYETCFEKKNREWCVKVTAGLQEFMQGFLGCISLLGLP